MGDEQLRELERRWQASGEATDEAAFFMARVRAGKISFLNGEASVIAHVVLHRLVQGGLNGQGLARLLEYEPLRLDVVQRANSFELAPPNEYADEEVASDFGYPEGFRFRTPAEQVEVWTQHFPELDSSHIKELASGPLPAHAEGWAVIPKPSRQGGYHAALERMLQLIVSQRPFQNGREGKTGSQHLRLIERTQAWLSQLESSQKGDYLAFPFQFGLRHRGRSIRRARVCFTPSEIGLGPYEVAALLVTHPDRISGYDQLRGIDCAGSEYDYEASGAFSGSMYFRWYDGRLSFVSNDVDSTYGRDGSASALAP